MKNSFNKKIKSVFVTALITVSTFFVNVQLLAGDLDEPELVDMRDILVRIMNWTIVVVGIVFALIVAYGAWKASTSLGDPRGLDSAKSTWVYAIYGMLIIVCFFAIFTIVAGFFGFSIGFDDIFSNIFEGIGDLIGIAIPEPS